jgi:mono/diheme cytochrome c family protein
VIFSKKIWTNFRRAAMALVLLASVSFAGATDDILSGYLKEAQKTDKSLKDFDPSLGEDFYHAKQTLKDGKTVSCSTCHMPDPKLSGKTSAGKSIAPMAVSVNPKRFTDKEKVEKWFKRNCKDVYKRLCTAAEKGHFIKYLQSVK